MASESDFGRITRQDLDVRFKALTADFYSQMVFLVKGAVITIAVVALLETFPRVAGQQLTDRMIFFGASFFDVLIPVVTYRRGMLLTSPRIHLLDYISPLGMGACEVMMFWVLSPERSTGVDYKMLWFLAVSMHAFFAVVLIFTRLASSPKRDFAEDLHELLSRYKRWLVIDLAGAAFLCVSTFAVFFAGNRMGLSDLRWRTGEWKIEALAWTFGPIELGGFEMAALGVGAIAIVVSLQAMSQHQIIGNWFLPRSPKGSRLPRS